MKRLGLLFALLLLASCTSLRDLQRVCEQTTSNFSDLVACLETQMETTQYKADGFDREYLLMAHTLREEVNAGTLSQTKARAELQHLHNEILINRARLQSLQHSRMPTQIECRVINDRYINCRPF